VRGNDEISGTGEEEDDSYGRDGGCSHDENDEVADRDSW